MPSSPQGTTGMPMSSLLSTPTNTRSDLHSYSPSTPSPPITHKASCTCSCGANSTTQSRLRAPRRTKWQKTNDTLAIIQKDFDSLGEFLCYLFKGLKRGEDPRTPKHRGMVTAFLQGSSNIHIGDIIELIYSHRQSQPGTQLDEAGLAYSPNTKLDDIRHARPCLSSWATQLVGEKVYGEVGKLTQNDPKDPEDRTQLRATRNSRSTTNVPQVTWEDLGKFSIPQLAHKLQERAPLAWYLAESMAGPQKNGKVIIRKRRPHPTIVVGAISAFVLARNRYANYLALNIGIWQFACKAHVDEKRVFSRFGLAVHDSTVRECLNSLSASSMLELRKSVAQGVAEGTILWAIVLDNVQQFVAQREHRIGRQDQLKVGTAATAIRLDDCAPGAFDLKDHLDCVIKQERCNLTANSLFDDVDWNHVADVQALHWVRVLVGFIPQLEHMRTDVSQVFWAPGIAKHRMCDGRKTVIQPLGTNAEREVETQGMMWALLDFEAQMGLDEKAMEGKIFIPRGDGASYAAVLRIKKYLSAHKSDYKAFRNRVSLPEVWHTRATNLGSMAENHYGPIGSPDPSSLSKSAHAVNTKRPANLKKVDFYPTARSVILFFEARVLDCWRIHLDVDDLLDYFSKLPLKDLPTLTTLRKQARVLVRRYASQEAYEQALSAAESTKASDTMRVQTGSPWSRPNETSDVRVQRTAGTAMADASTPVEPEFDDEAIDVDLEPISDAEDEIETPAEESKDETSEQEKKKKAYVETKDFDGDRVLANAILFLQDAGWWVEASYAVSEGDIGRVYEIIKIWIFSFTGTSNRNYSSWLLELYCLLRYEASKDLSNALLNNWLVNLTGELGKWIEGDLMQEHYNRWLEDMAGKLTGNFDDKFYRQTLSPNVNHFLRIKEEIESAFGLTRRSKAHGSAHLRDEFQSLLRMHKEDKLHCFRMRRSMGHAAVNTFDRGYRRLDEGRIAKFLKQSLAYSNIVKEMEQLPVRLASETPACEGNIQVEARESFELERQPEIPSGADEVGDESDDAEEQYLGQPLAEQQGGDTSDSDQDSISDDEDQHYRPTAEQQAENCAHHAMFIDQESGEMIIDSNNLDDTYDFDDSSDEEEADMGEDSDVDGYSSASDTGA